jgi:hypothetical protein
MDITLTWNPVVNDDQGNPLPAGTVVTYNLYGAIGASPPTTPLPLIQGGITGTTSVRQNVDPGNHYYEVTASIPGPDGKPIESADSLELTVVVPLPQVKPAAPDGVKGVLTTPS